MIRILHVNVIRIVVRIRSGGHSWIAGLLAILITVEWRRVEGTQFVCLRCLRVASSFFLTAGQGTVWSYFRLTIKPDLGNGDNSQIFIQPKKRGSAPYTECKHHIGIYWHLTPGVSCSFNLAISTALLISAKEHHALFCDKKRSLMARWLRCLRHRESKPPVRLSIDSVGPETGGWGLKPRNPTCFPPARFRFLVSWSNQSV